ncbi:MAG TPA: zinc metalloprotease [Ferruginibacter sp.]|nr:zinc metalloprotease [Ferruginibacter sp.]
MKKTIFVFATGILFAFGCNKTSIVEENQIADDLAAPTAQRRCASQEVLERLLKEDPSLAGRMNDIENFTTRFTEDPTAFRLVNGVIEIPVVVNVLYRTAAENISDAQIASQITVLNKDFQALNTDYNSTPSIFQSVRSGNTNVRFVLDQTIRKSTTKSSWTTNDAMKKTSKGGLNPTSPTTKLNLWCCNLGGGILGYAQFPGGSSSTDGVVIDNNAFGSTGTVSAPYNKGRTATHEVGHWLNLRHIWGDATCGNDQVGDTPLHNTANYGCPTYPHRSTCSGTPVEMTMNYMDYTDDACMYMFTAGQKTRMQAVFAAGGARNSFAQP